MNTDKPKIYINPPPQDKCCQCCGKNAKDLKPYGKAGDPLVGDFDGAILLKTFRTVDGTTSASWECRDCICLSNKAYIKRSNEEYEKRKSNKRKN